MHSAVNKKHHNEISIAQLFTWSEKNPNRGHCLTPIEVIGKPVHDEMVSIENMSNVGMPYHTCISLDPPGPLSIFQWICDPVFQTMSSNVRKNMNRCFATSLQERISSLRSGTVGRKRNALCDFISRCADDRVTQDDNERRDLMELLSSFLELQLILVITNDDSPGNIVFMSDPVNWTGLKNIWIADYDARWIASVIPETSQQLWSVSTWLSDRESMGWIIHWPEVTGKKTELVAQLQLLQPETWQPTDTKLLKDELSKRLGKHLMIRNLLAIQCSKHIILN